MYWGQIWSVIGLNMFSIVVSQVLEPVNELVLTGADNTEPLQVPEHRRHPKEVER